ncbi:MAG: hypothetical protein DRP22_00495 [Verrucomicrobia bacterium]|nr:MAG: hypothetical protein DRP22_00495 [Verrucomicrobiota bacterium]
MRIILDFRKYDGVVGGVEQGALQIARYAAKQGHHIILVAKQARTAAVRELVSQSRNIEVVPVRIRSHAISPRNAWLDNFYFPRLASRISADLIHFYYNWSFPFHATVPCLLTVHDVIPFTFREAMGWWRNHFLYRPAIRLACRLNDHITTVSEFSRRDIAKRTGVPLEKITVIPNGLRSPSPFDETVWSRLVAKLGLSEGYILNSGGIHERKNTIALLEAFSILVREMAYRGKLVITGAVSGAPYQDKMKSRCDAAVRRLDLESRVVFAGYVSEKELDLLMMRADVFVYPSLYEGFGIPVLEAMQVGTPVVASSLTAIPEIAGDAALLVDPRSPRRIAEAISMVLRDAALRERLIAQGRSRASRFSWEGTACAYLELYHRMLGEHARR